MLCLLLVVLCPSAPKLSWRWFKATWHEVADHVDVITSANFTALSITSCLTHHVCTLLLMQFICKWMYCICEAHSVRLVPHVAAARCCFRSYFEPHVFVRCIFLFFYFFHAHRVQRKLQEYTCCGGTLKVFTHCRLPQLPLVKVSAFISFITAPAPQLTYLHSRWLVWW